MIGAGLDVVCWGISDSQLNSFGARDSFPFASYSSCSSELPLHLSVCPPSGSSAIPTSSPLNVVQLEVRLVQQPQLIARVFSRARDRLCAMSCDRRVTGV